MIVGVIYLITNLLNGKKYVGQTIQRLNIRMNHHRRGGDLYIDRAIRKYGRENFKVEVLEECYTVEQLNEREKFWIIELNCKHPNGYNHTDGGEGTAGLKHTYEQYAGRAANFRGNSPYPNLIAEMNMRKLAYRAFAKLMDNSYVSISRKISGERPFTDKDKSKLVEIFGKPIEYLLECKNFIQPQTHCEVGLEKSAAHRYDSPYPNLIAEIKRRKLTYTALAKLFGITQPTLSRKIKGEYNFTAKDKFKLEEFFQKPISYLLRRADG